MAKYYIAKMFILDPKDLVMSNILSTYSTEEILVKKVPFGYREVITNHFFRIDDYMSITPRDCYVHTSEMESALRHGEKLFFLDRTLSFPLREAELKDAEEYLKRFDASFLKFYYDENARLREVEKDNKKIKTLINNYKTQNQEQD